MTPEVAWLGRVPYREALRRQQDRREAVISGAAPEAFWLLEHDPVITTGRRVVADLPDRQALRAHGIDLVATERGGLATWHGPGQLVGYLVLDLPSRGLKVRGMVAALEQGITDWLAGRGVAACRREGAPGVWAATEEGQRPRYKLCAVGLHFRRGVSMHGFALNLCPDLSGFDWITPCGITDGGVTSVRAILGTAPSPEEAASGVAEAVLRAIPALTPGGAGDKRSTR